MDYKSKKRASASKITLYHECARKYYYKYKLGIKEPNTLPLIKGSCVHKVLEEFFDLNPRKTTINGKNYKTELYVYMDNLMEKVLNQPTKTFGKIGPSYSDQIKELCKNDFEFAIELNDIKSMLHNYLILFIMQVNTYMSKYNNFPQSYYMLRPKFREFEIDLPDFTGYIDLILENNNRVQINDYKSSTLYATGYNPSYMLQLKLYAYGLYRMKNIIADIGEIFYLRFGRECCIEFDKLNVVREMEEVVKDFYEKTKSDDIENYPMCTEYAFCTCSCSKNPNGFKNGTSHCYFDKFCNQELEGYAINYNVE